MVQKRRVNRIVLLFSSIGKPLYWLLITPVLVWIIVTQILRYSLKDLPKVSGWLVALIISVVSISYGSYWFYIHILKDLPTPKDLLNHTSPLTTKIYDRNHTLLYKIYKNENRSLIPLDQISPYMVNATIAIEDKDFYSHFGISFKGILRSLKLALFDKRIQGGSTITQQLVKNTLLTSERTLTRKIKEIILALQVEQSFSKNQILEMYLNEVSYGGSVYGAQEAAQKYFHKSASDLDLAESSFLAGLPASPSTYSPTGPNSDLAKLRQTEVLHRMMEDQKISTDEAKLASSEPLNIQLPLHEIKAPHFVMYVRDLLEQKFGTKMVAQGGLEVTTSLDLNTQTQAENIVREEVKQLTSKHVSNGAALVTNPKTGEILAMVGSVNYFDRIHDGQVNLTLRLRQPGSSIKPLMYSAALEHGFTPISVLDDSPIAYPSKWGPPYVPQNYDGTFHGRETLRVALASSHNIPAVKTENEIGLQTFINQARKLGITSWDDASRFGLSLTLGAGEVKMIDMATAYGVFANNGDRVDLNPILSVKGPAGEDLYESPCPGPDCANKNVISSAVAFQITSILSDNLARSRAFGFNSVLNIPGQQVAVKTGTTNSLRDNWTIGYTSDRLVATWVGNNDNTPMSAVVSGITGASPIWNQIIKLQLQASNVFAPPSNLVSVPVCAQTGKPACSGCPNVYTEYLLPGTVPASDCNPTLTAAAY